MFFEIIPKAKAVGGTGKQHILAMILGFAIFLPSLYFRKLLFLVIKENVKKNFSLQIMNMNMKEKKIQQSVTTQRHCRYKASIPLYMTCILYFFMKIYIFVQRGWPLLSWFYQMV